ncbi:MAG TPA: isocitrate/isopropylmalate dehydrogenase family protein [Tepidisphaeraceae bacterium]|jgi:isocitrate dehydrogenase (NAD+)
MSATPRNHCRGRFTLGIRKSMHIVAAKVNFMPKHTIVLIPGDGIGPEVTVATKRVIEAAGLSVEWVELPAGATAIEQGFDNVLPQRTLAAIKAHKVALKGPVTTPVGKGFRSVNVLLRKSLNLYAAVRPVRTLPGIKTRFDNIDMVIIRENTEGLYSGIENEVIPGVVTSLKVATEAACTRVSRFAFRYATRRGRKRITVFHKANIMKMTDGLFLDCARRIHEEEYPNIEYEEVIIDAGCMKLVQNPSRMDMLLMENLYGDLVSDLCAGLVGGLGCTPGANIGDDAAVFEAVHGSAPDIAGKGVANPLALIMSAVMMLNHIHEEAIAAKIRAAYDAVLTEGKSLTRDLGGSAGTNAFADAVIANF